MALLRSPNAVHSASNTISAAAASAAKSLQLCPTLCNPIDDSPPGSPVPGILQARTLEWVAISFSMVLISTSYIMLQTSVRSSSDTVYQI